MYWVATQLGSSYKGSPKMPYDDVSVLNREKRLLAPGEHWSSLRGPGKFGTQPGVRLRSDDDLRKVIDRYSSPQPNGCVFWTSKRKHKAGYGVVTVGYSNVRFSKNGKPHNVLRFAHHVAWELANGSVPAGLELDHECRNRNCVALRCIRAVTHQQNARNSGPALRTHCVKGHPFFGSNLIFRADRGKLRRRCAECLRTKSRESARRKNAWPKPKKTHCARGHEYTPENVYFRPSRHGSRVCRTCAMEYQRRLKPEAKVKRPSARAQEIQR
jgi:hypothetical protein